MSLFECCRECTAPKRHPGCHSTCKEYLKARKTQDDINAKINASKTAYPRARKWHFYTT